MPAATGNGPACNESHEPAQERPEPVATCAFIEEERRGDPTGLLYALGPRSGESRERVAEWLAALVHHFYLDGPVEPPRTTPGSERCETALAFCRCCGQPFDFSPQARGAVAAEPISPPGPRRRRRRCAATGAEECLPPSAAGAEMGDVVALALGGDLAAVHQGRRGS